MLEANKSSRNKEVLPPLKMEKLETTDLTLAKLRDYLLSSEIPVDTWGSGTSKTIQHLIDELQSGESTLGKNENGEIIRTINGVGLNVYFEDGNNKLVLIEEEQIFNDGRKRRRKLKSSIGEKMKTGEDPVDAAKRSMLEELGMSNFKLPTTYIVEDREPVNSDSFPGLITKNTVYVFDCYVADEEFNPSGYIEEQTDKTTYFVWREVAE